MITGWSSAAPPHASWRSVIREIRRPVWGAADLGCQSGNRPADYARPSIAATSASLSEKPKMS